MSILDDIKAVAKEVQQTGNMELYGRVLNLQAQILDLLQQSNDLRSQVVELQSRQKTEEKFVFRNNAYWIDDENVLDGPFCSNCWDTKQLKVRLLKNQPGAYTCSNCKNDIRAEFMAFDMGPLTINNLW